MTAITHRQAPRPVAGGAPPDGVFIAAPSRNTNRAHVVPEKLLCPRAGLECGPGNASAALQTCPTQPSQDATLTARIGAVNPAMGHAAGITQRRPNLSTREVEVLIAWLRTDSKTAVGNTLYITAATVRTHIQRIRDKYDAVGRPAPTKAALTVRAIQDGLITVDDL